MNFYPRYPAHYVAKTLHLTMEQDGAYTRLLDWCYMNERPVPNGQRYAIARATKPSEKRAVDDVLSEFFSRVENEWENDRVSSEIAEAAPRIASAKANGRKGGRPKKAPDPGTPPGGAEKPSGKPGGIPSSKAPQSPIPNSPPDTQDPHHAQSAAVWGQFEGHDLPSATPNPAARHAIALNRAGVQVTSLNPDLVAYVAEGGTPEHLAELAALPDFRGKPAAYVIRAARRMHAEKAAPVTAGEAHATPRKLSAVERVRANCVAAERRDAEAAASGNVYPHPVAAHG